MSTQKLSEFEKQVVSSLAHRAGLAASILDAWADMPNNSIQSERTLANLAQLGVTEERAVREVLERSADLGLLTTTRSGFQPHGNYHRDFKRLALALNAIEHYVSAVHKDATTAQIVMTKPAKPSTLEQKLSDLGWRTSELEQTDRAFLNMVRFARHRVVVMTPFLDVKGALWLRELFSLVQAGVERVLILRSLDNTCLKSYPEGYDSIASWLKAEDVQVYNYSLPRLEGGGRESFHAKVILCDQNIAYLGSSNMNTASLEHSMEMGVVLRGRAVCDVAVVLDAVMRSAVKWI